MVRRVAQFVLVLILAQFATSIINNTVLENNDINLNGLKTRRKTVDRSTSSSSGSIRTKEGTRETGAESLNVEFTTSDSSDEEDSDGLPKSKKKKKRREPQSTAERKGWRKWHRKCTKCPQDMLMKWRDPSIKWICGAYQQARRTFKSLCMMHYRNCQDGTMFTKIADHRCPNGTREIRPYNNHFFYDYKVKLTDDETTSGSDTVSDADSSTSVSDSEIEKNLPPFKFERNR